MYHCIDCFIFVFLIFFLIDKEKNNIKHAKTGGAPYVHRQYTKKVKTRQQKKKKNLERKKLTNKPITQKIQKRKRVQVQKLLRLLKKRLKKEVPQASI